jgi:serine/threonine protein kinase, bacterial
MAFLKVHFMVHVSRFKFLICMATIVLAGCGGSNQASIRPSETVSFSQSRSDEVAQPDYSGALQALYISYYGRPADPAGLAFWSGVLQASGAPTSLQGLSTAYSNNSGVKTVIDSFGNSAESQALYGVGDTRAFIASIYQNVLGRYPDQAGLNYWVALVDGGNVTKAQAAMVIMAAAAAEPATSSDEQLVSNRLAVSTYFTSQVSAQQAKNAYSGSAANAIARLMLFGVNATTDISNYQNNVIIALTKIEQYTIGGIVNNLTGAGLTLSDGTETIVIQANSSSIHFPTPLPRGTSYNVQIISQPSAFTDICMVAHASGTVFYDSVSDVTVTCRPALPTVTTLAGSTTAGDVDGAASSARFNSPSGVAVDANGNVYVADKLNSVIRKVTPAGMVSTVVNDSNTESINSQMPNLAYPESIALDGSGTLYIADTAHDMIRKVNANGVAVMFAGNGTRGNNNGVGAQATFNTPDAIAIDKSGNIFVADTGNQLIRKITPAGVVSTYAGSGMRGSANGPALEASFADPVGVTVDGDGNVYVADSANNLIRKITPDRIVSTFAGSGSKGRTNGVGTTASFFFPTGLAVDSANNVYVADHLNSLIRKITPPGVVTTIAGGFIGNYADGVGANASFQVPYGVAVDATGNVYVGDTQNNLIRKISAQ